MCLAALPVVSGISYGYFDGVVLVWLLIGIFRGRHRGMTQELLPTLQWLGIVVLAGLFYSPFSGFIMQNTSGAFTRLWANVSAYVIIAFGINLCFMWLKQTVGEKLMGSDIFGRSEYYLGMLSGLLRYSCMIVVLFALMHSRIYTQAELAEEAKAQKKNFEDIRFPTYKTIQHTILMESFTGRLVQDHLSPVLIAAAPPPKPRETVAQKSQETINSILGAQKK